MSRPSRAGSRRSRPGPGRVPGAGVPIRSRGRRGSSGPGGRRNAGGRAGRPRRGLHRLPAGEVRDAGVTDLPRPDQVVQGGQHLLDGGAGVEGVQLEQVDVVGVQAAQGVVDGRDQAGPGGPRPAGAVARGEACLGGDEHLVPAPLEGGPQDLLRGAGGVDVGGVEHRDPGIDADVHEAARLLYAGVAPGAEERPLPAEGARSEAQFRDQKPGRTQPPVLHDASSHRPRIHLMGLRFR